MTINDVTVTIVYENVNCSTQRFNEKKTANTATNLKFIQNKKKRKKCEK